MIDIVKCPIRSFPVAASLNARVSPSAAENLITSACYPTIINQYMLDSILKYVT